MQRYTIYKISCKSNDVYQIYIGSTNNIKTRANAHKSNSQNETSRKYNYKLYRFIRANGGFSNWDVEKIDEIECYNRNEAAMRERYWTELLGAELNGQIPSRTPKEYKQGYYVNNKERINEKIECPYCGVSTTRNHIRRHQRTLKCIKIQQTQKGLG